MEQEAHVEYTDTFGGEANYCWVKRFTLPGQISDLQAVRRAKALVGLTGVRGRTYKHGGNIEFRPYRMATVLFIFW
jgi:hypothetical protein